MPRRSDTSKPARRTAAYWRDVAARTADRALRRDIEVLLGRREQPGQRPGRGQSGQGAGDEE